MRIATLKNKVEEIRWDLEERVFELQDRDDPEGKWQEEIEEIEQLMELLEQMEYDLADYE